MRLRGGGGWIGVRAGVEREIEDQAKVFEIVVESHVSVSFSVGGGSGSESVIVLQLAFVSLSIPRVGLSVIYTKPKSRSVL